MSTVFSWTCQIISGVSIAFNIYLLNVYFRCPLRMIRSYKYFFLLTAIQNLGFSMTLLLLVPILISHNFSIMFLSTGPLQSQIEGQVLMLLYCSTFITSLHIVADSFIYRYLQVCKPHFFLSHLKPRYVLIAVLLNILILINWAIIVLAGFWPSSEFKSDFSDFFELATGMKSFHRAQLGFSMKYSLTPFTLALVIEVAVLMSLIGVIVVYSAININRTLKEGALSKNLRKVHQQMFVLLLIQTVCPFAFLHGPATFAYFLLFAGVTSSPAMSHVITILMTFYPLFGPVIIVVFVKDYRSYTLSLLRCFSLKSTSVPSGTNNVFVWICQSISALSIVLNVYLLYVYFRCPLKTPPNRTVKKKPLTHFLDVAHLLKPYFPRDRRTAHILLVSLSYSIKYLSRPSLWTEMGTAFSWACQIISGVSIAFNIYLLYVYFRCPLRMIRSYKYFFLLTAIQNLGFSITLLLLVPIVISHDFSFMFLSTGPLQSQPEGQVLMLLFCSTFITSLHLVADSFIYRYLQVCKPHFFLSHLKPRYVFIAVLLNILILINWAIIVLVGFWPSSEFKSDFSDFFQQATGLKSFDRAQLGFSMKYSLTPFTLALVIEVAVLESLVGTIVVYSAIHINRTLKEGALSKNLRRLHQQMFVLLLLQTACPFAFLHGPTTFAYFLLFAGVTSTPAMSHVITILMTFYPLFGPVIIVFFVKDYRNYILSPFRCFSRKSESVASVFVSEMRTNQVIVLSVQ